MSLPPNPPLKWSSNVRHRMPASRITRALRVAKLARALGDYDTNVLDMVGETIGERQASD